MCLQVDQHQTSLYKSGRTLCSILTKVKVVLHDDDLSSPDRGGVAGPAGPALAGPLFSGSLVSFPLFYWRIRSPARPDRIVSAPTCC